MADPSSFIDKFARIGYSAKALIYLTIASLAAESAISGGGKDADAKSSLETLGAQPWGWVILGALLIGLICYVIWRFVATFAANTGDKDGVQAIAERIGRFVSGLTYVGLAYAVVRLLSGEGSGAENGTGEAASKTMSQPMGEWLVILLGLIVLGVGVHFLYRSFTASYRKKFTVTEGSETLRTWVDRSARIGIAARGFVFLLIGGFLVIAGWQSDASEAKGMGGALQFLHDQAYGSILLGFMAIGLAAYAIYCFVRARYGHIKT
ncbi:MAG: DUF1206 domain-containing protein [Chthoniobacterales bacterium]